MSINSRNPFGSGSVKPTGEAPEEPESDSLYESEPHGDQNDGIVEEGNLDLSGTGSLAGIAIRRKRTGGGARPATQPPVGSPRPQDSPPRNIMDFWSRLKKGRRWPARGDIDAKQVGTYWPNTVLMRVGENGVPWQFESLMSGVVRGSGQGFHTGEVEFGNSLVMEWILELGRRTQRAGQAQEDADTFPTQAGDVRYRAMAVPLGEDDAAITHVLCHVLII